jgi:hypothetical protein
MDRKVLIKSLKKLFCDINKTEKKYSEVWISDIDYGGLYHSDKYVVLNVKTEHQISSCYEEIGWIIKYLDEKAHEELQSIWRVQVYNADDRLHCVEDGISVYDEEDACK